MRLGKTSKIHRESHKIKYIKNTQIQHTIGHENVAYPDIPSGHGITHIPSSSTIPPILSSHLTLRTQTLPIALTNLIIVHCDYFYKISIIF